MHTVKDCERYNTVRELLLLHELPVSPSPRRPDELPVTARDRCWAPASWLSPATGLARRPPSRHHCHQVQRLFSSSSSMFSQHIRSLLVIFFPKLPMNMSVGWTMPPIPAPLLLPKELLVPYALHLGNWICSSYRSTSPMQRVLKHKASPELHTSVWLPASISLWH